MKRIKIDGKDLNIMGIGINEEKKEVTVASKDQNKAMIVEILKMCKSGAKTFEEHEAVKDLIEKGEKKVRIVTKATCHKGDDFDPVIGVALALCYNLFGSKTQFHKFVKKIQEDQNK